MRQLAAVLASISLYSSAIIAIQAAPTSHQPTITRSNAQKMLKMAIIHDNVAEVKRCLTLGANPNVSDDGCNPLSLTVLNGADPAITRILLARGAKVEAKNSDGTTPLGWADLIIEGGGGSHPSNLKRTRRLLLAASHSTDEVATPKLELISTHEEIDPATGYWSVTGLVKNQSRHTYRYVEVTVNFYSSAGDQVDSVNVNTQHLAAGATWDFKATSTAAGAGKYKVVELKGDR